MAGERASIIRCNTKFVFTLVKMSALEVAAYMLPPIRHAISRVVVIPIAPGAAPEDKSGNLVVAGPPVAA